MACLIDTPIDSPACPGETPGAFDTLWQANRTEITGFTLTGDTITNITFAAGKGFIMSTAKKGSIVARDSKVDDTNASTNYTQEIDVAYADLSPSTRDAVNEQNGATLLNIVRTKGGRYIVGGYAQGMEMKINNMTTAADGLGEFITYRETEVNEKMRRMLDTDDATTLALLMSKTVAS